MFYEGINAKVFRRSIAFAIEEVVMSRSCSLEYTISVHADAERKVWYIVVSTETPQTSTNPSQTLLPVYKLAHLPLLHPKSSTPRPTQPPLAQPFAQLRYLCLFFLWRCHNRERSRMWRRNKFTFTWFRGSPADAHMRFTEVISHLFSILSSVESTSIPCTGSIGCYQYRPAFFAKIVNVTHLHINLRTCVVPKNPLGPFLRL